MEFCVRTLPQDVNPVHKTLFIIAGSDASFHIDSIIPIEGHDGNNTIGDGNDGNNAMTNGTTIVNSRVLDATLQAVYSQLVFSDKKCKGIFDMLIKGLTAKKTKLHNSKQS
jgi:hypothetical protein